MEIPPPCSAPKRTNSEVRPCQMPTRKNVTKKQKTPRKGSSRIDEMRRISAIKRGLYT